MLTATPGAVWDVTQPETATQKRMASDDFKILIE